MSQSKEKIYKFSGFPVIPLRGTVAYPAIPINLELGRKRSAAAIDAALLSDSRVLLVPQKNAEIDKPSFDDLFTTGTVARIKNSSKTPAGTTRVLLECESRAIVDEFRNRRFYLSASGVSKTIVYSDNGGVRSEALKDEAKRAFEKYAALLPSTPDDAQYGIDTIKDPGLLADYLASNLIVKFENKIKVLNEFDPLRRLEALILAMENEMDLLECELDIHKKVRESMDENQRDYYLREQMNAIRDELGMNDDEEDNFENAIKKANLPEYVSEKLLKENARLQKTPFGSAEANVINSYIEKCLEIPWSSSSPDRKDMEKAKKILERDHNGLEEVKTRALEYLAVRSLTDKQPPQILCLIGPPGVGKTSVARSIADAVGKKYARISLGGVRDEADIRGHRKTYIGAMPGRIIDALISAGTNNPLILLDEIDKLGSDFRGDPASALLEVLDPEQNRFFRDHYVEMPFDLSGCMFIATANGYQGIPAPLFDRMEIIEMSGYTTGEKVSIARSHLIPKQIKLNGLTSRNISFTEEGIVKIIREYTRESGVRNLERSISSICRKRAASLVAGKKGRLTVTGDVAAELLGPEKIIRDEIPKCDTVGLINGMAYTESGGDLLPIEVTVMQGTGKIELTGSLGEVMKESAHIAVSYIRSVAEELGIEPDFYKTKDIHLHAPEGAIPKDGPSAGMAMACAIASALTGRPIRHDLSMTGELSLLGRAIAIGGLKEKTLAALYAGVKTVVLPEDNRRDLQKLPEEVKKGMEFVFVTNVSEAIDRALLPSDTLKEDDVGSNDAVLSRVAMRNVPQMDVEVTQ